MNRIKKMKYIITCFDFDIMAFGRKDIYELYPDGRVVFKRYQAGNRKCTKKNVTTSASSTDYYRLCSKLDSCISKADRVNSYIDDASAELKLYRSFGRQDKLPRGYGNANEDVGHIVCEYLFHAAGMDR